MNNQISQIESGKEYVHAKRYLWLTLPIISSAVLSQALTGLGIPILYPFMQREFALSYAQLGFITSGMGIGLTAAVTITGWLADFLGVKRIIVTSLLLMSGFTLGLLLASNYIVVLVLAVLIGIAASPIYPATTKAIMERFPSRTLALAMSLKHSGFPIGGALTAAVLPVIAISMGWRLAAAFTGLLVLLCAILFGFAYHDARKKTDVVRRFNFATLNVIVHNRTLLTTLVWGFVILGLQYIVLTYFILFLIEEIKLSAVIAGGLLAVAQGISIVSRVFWGAASDFIFHGKRINILAITGMLAAVGMLAAGFIKPGVSFGILYLIIIAIGMSAFSYHGVFSTLVGELSEEGHVGLTMGIASMTQHFGQMILPPLFGYLIDVSHSYSLAWKIAAITAFLFTIILLVFSRDGRFRKGPRV